MGLEGGEGEGEHWRQQGTEKVMEREGWQWQVLHDIGVCTRTWRGDLDLGLEGLVSEAGGLFKISFVERKGRNSRFPGETLLRVC